MFELWREAYKFKFPAKKVYAGAGEMRWFSD